jgi:threonine/homoserine/homoserine lactone efflux protein
MSLLSHLKFASLLRRRQARIEPGQAAHILDAIVIGFVIVIVAIVSIAIMVSAAHGIDEMKPHQVIFTLIGAAFIIGVALALRHKMFNQKKK